MKMANDPAFLFYSSDFLTGVSDLDMEERGQYITLLCLQHQKGPLNEKTIRLCVGYASVSVLAKFTQNDKGEYYNERLEYEVLKRASYTASRRMNGKKGGRPPKREKSQQKNLGETIAKPYGFGAEPYETPSVLNGSGELVEHQKEENHSFSETEPKPRQNHMENENDIENTDTVRRDKGGAGEKEKSIQFAEVWDAYGKKLGKQAAATKWKNLSRKDRRAAAEHIPKFRAAHEAAGKLEYLAHFSTYLNQRRWEDEELPYQNTPQPRHNHQNGTKPPGQWHNTHLQRAFEAAKNQNDNTEDQGYGSNETHKLD